MINWISVVSGAPTTSNFVTTQGQGTPIVIDKLSGIAYFYDGSGIRSLNQSFFITPKQFGAVGDGITDDWAAFNAAIQYRANNPIDSDGFVIGAGGIYVPAGKYYISQPLDFACGLIFQGEAVPGHAPATQLLFPDTLPYGLGIQYATTSGAGNVVAAHNYGDHTTFKNIGIIGPMRNTETGITGGEAEYHGIRAMAPYIIEDCYINGFRGDGLYQNSTSGGGAGLEGNTNISQVNRLRVTNVRNGVYIDGADANQCTMIAVNSNYCRQHAVWDSSFLGNVHIGHHAANTGLIPGVPSSVVSYLGNRYGVVNGQAVGASTNAPSGTTADNTWWYYLGAGGPNAGANIPLWVAAVSVREGGGYRTDNANARNNMISLYQEGGENVSQFVAPTLTIGGTWGSRNPVTTGNELAGNYANLPSLNSRNKFGLTTVYDTTNTSAQLIVHNSSNLAAGIFSRIDICQGYEANGTELVLAGIRARPSTAVVGTTDGVLEFFTRTPGGAGAITTHLIYEAINNSLYPGADNTENLGLGGIRYTGIFAYNIDAKTAFKVNGIQVMGPRITGWGAPTGTATRATFATSTVTLPVLAEHVKALIDDLTTQGTIGP